MPKDPMVCGVMLTRDRPAMARRAVECFRAQTYQNKRLLILDSSKLTANIGSFDGMAHVWMPEMTKARIGAFRNAANQSALGWCDAMIFAHFDDDDWSHPNRIAEQVALLQSSGKQCVGYRDMLFWNTDQSCVQHARERCSECGEDTISQGEAWLYSNPNTNYALGTSLCYWRWAWEARPFEDRNEGEDKHFILGLDTVGVTSLPIKLETGADLVMRGTDVVPRMIASIHAGNTSSAYGALNLPSWKRVPEWDAHCKGKMKL
jgi:glycosyltransferase involved in cell wall biosynthesis